MKRRVLIQVFILLSFALSAQTEAPPDTSHSVRKAAIFSAVVPGAGQVYNHLAMPKGKGRAFWKVPLIYLGLGATGYMVYTNYQEAKILKQEYLNRQAGIPGLEEYKFYDDQGILTLRTSYLNRRDLFILGFTVVYVLQVVDAAVEAHFVNFDISEDLSLHLSPAMPGIGQPGVKLSFNFR